MRRAIPGALLVVLAWAGQGRAGDEGVRPPASAESDAGQEEAPVPPDSLISREDWKRRIEEARHRADEARRERRLNGPLPDPDPPERVATERVLEDDMLQSGDIVSTDKGLFLFRGKSGEPRKAADFVPLTPGSIVVAPRRVP